ncbi:hypothetical protein PUN71_022185 [Arthrobacter sp. NQ7]|uniref:hypothetical protein n=1 Tax=Arthrobacter sp. NQ7 TaxID=3032303 RepID=UPI0024B87F42|nr:hypothetical protein [Arthrobacter sp. NQ7]MDJ0459920.1 hypothetical protein [Arthrobacter sp. NQ7]
MGTDGDMELPSYRTGGQLLSALGITVDSVHVAIRVADRHTTTGHSPTPSRTFAVFVPTDQSIFNNGGKV